MRRKTPGRRFPLCRELYSRLYKQRYGSLCHCTWPSEPTLRIALAPGTPCTLLPHSGKCSPRKKGHKDKPLRANPVPPGKPQVAHRLHFLLFQLFLDRVFSGSHYSADAVGEGVFKGKPRAVEQFYRSVGDRSTVIGDNTEHSTGDFSRGQTRIDLRFLDTFH